MRYSASGLTDTARYCIGPPPPPGLPWLAPKLVRMPEAFCWDCEVARASSGSVEVEVDAARVFPEPSLWNKSVSTFATSGAWAFFSEKVLNFSARAGSESNCATSLSICVMFSAAAFTITAPVRGSATAVTLVLFAAR